jgi:hypothetical protein
VATGITCPVDNIVRRGSPLWADVYRHAAVARRAGVAGCAALVAPRAVCLSSRRSTQ